MKPLSPSRLAFLACLAALSAGAAQATVFDTKCTTINLRTGAYTALPKSVSFVVSPLDSNADGYYEAVLKVKVDRPKLFDLRAFALFVTYDGDPEGNSLNIGDSETNDGGSGDGESQSNDAELQIGRQADTRGGMSKDATMWVFPHDGYPADPVDPEGTPLAVVPQSVKAGDTITFAVANDRVAFDNRNKPLRADIQSPWLYALNGQADTEGPVNGDMFVGLNRVIYDPFFVRIGRGVGNVRLCTD